MTFRTKKAATAAILLAVAFPAIAQPGISRHAKPHTVTHVTNLGVSWKALPR